MSSEDRKTDPGETRQIPGASWKPIRDYQDIRFECHEKVAHSQPPGQPGRAYKFVGQKRRNAFPTKIVWEYNANPWIQPDSTDEGKATRRPKQWMYWLHCKDPRDYMMVTAVRKDEGGVHVIDLTVPKMCFPDGSFTRFERVLK